MKNRKAIYPFSARMENMRQMLKEAEVHGDLRPTHVFDTIAQQENEELVKLIPPPDESDDFGLLSHELLATKVPKGLMEKIRVDPPFVHPNPNVMKANANSLTFAQRLVFDEYIHFAKSIVCAENGGKIDPTPPRFIVTGN